MIDPTIRHAVRDLARRIGDGGGPSSAPTRSPPCPHAAAMLGRDRPGRRHLSRQRLRIPDAAMGMRLRAEASQGRLRRLARHLRHLPHRVIRKAPWLAGGPTWPGARGHLLCLRGLRPV